MFCLQADPKACVLIWRLPANSQPVRGRSMIAPTFTEAVSSKNVGAAISRPRRNDCVYIEISAKSQPVRGGTMWASSPTVRPSTGAAASNALAGADAHGRPAGNVSFISKVPANSQAFGTGDPSPTERSATGAAASNALAGADAHSRPAENVAFIKRPRRIRRRLGRETRPLRRDLQPVQQLPMQS